MLRITDAADGADTFANPLSVFEYTFKLPGEEKSYRVMWDYNVGLVRMTPFFKSCKYGKVSFFVPLLIPPNPNRH